MDVKRSCQQYISYLVNDRFIGGGHWGIQRKPVDMSQVTYKCIVKVDINPTTM